jgi:uncharacterized protein YndB with AHSA1/START domain
VDGDVVSVERIIPAAPGAIFDLIADASRHPDIDGSGTVKAVKAGRPERLSAGSSFGMSMHMGVRYSMVNTVVEFEDNRRIAWTTAPGGLVGRFIGGRLWRYELEPVEGGTRVTETWDISGDHQRVFLRLGGLAEKTRSNMQSTLARIEQLTAPGSS